MWKTYEHPFESIHLVPISAATKEDSNSPIPILQALRRIAFFHDNEQERGPGALWWMSCRRQAAESVSKRTLKMLLLFSHPYFSADYKCA